MYGNWHKGTLVGLVLVVAVIALGSWLWAPQPGVASTDMPQNVIEAKALADAKVGIEGYQLEQAGTIASIRRMTLGQANVVLDLGRSPDPDWSTPVWAILFNGGSTFSGGLPVNGVYPKLGSDDDSFFVVMGTSGDVWAVGPLPVGAPRPNLDAPLPVVAPSGPTATPNKQTPGPTSTPASAN